MSTSKFRRSNSLTNIRQSSGTDSLRPTARSKSAIRGRSSGIPKPKRSSSSSSIRLSSTRSTDSVPVKSRLPTSIRDSKSVTPNSFYTPQQSNLKRQNLYGSNSNKSPLSSRKTQRWTDKKSSNEHYEKVARFIETSNLFDLEEANAGNIKPPTINTFIYVTQVLFEQTVPRSKITKQNYITLIPTVLKTLNYPGNFPGSSLKIVSSMHVWHQVMKVWSFLIDFIEPPSYLDEEDDPFINLLFNYTSDMYVNFNNFDDTAVRDYNEEIHFKCKENLELLLGLHRKDYEMLQEDVEKAKEKEHQLNIKYRNNEEQIESLKNEIEVIEKRIDAVTESIVTMEHSTEQDLKYYMKQSAEISEQVKFYETNLAKLKTIINDQKYDTNYKNELHIAIEQIVNENIEMETEIAHCDRYLQQSEENIKNLNHKIKTAVSAWNMLIACQYFENELSRENQSFADEYKKQLSLKEIGFNGKHFLDTLKNVQQLLISKNEEYKNIGINLEQMIKKYKTDILKLKHENNGLEQQVKIITELTESLNNEINKHEYSLKEMNFEIQQKEGTFVELMKKKQAECLNQKQSFIELNETYKKRKSKVDADCLKCYNFFLKVKQDVMQVFSEMDQVRERFLDKQIEKFRQLEKDLLTKLDYLQ